MPSLFTHAFTGAAISALAPRPYRSAILGATLAIAAALPDLDVIGHRLGIPYAHFLGHRGFSHSVLCAAIVAAAIWSLTVRREVRPARRRVALFAVIFLACASHGILDAFTDAGLGVGFLIPFDNTRYFAPWRPILTSPLRIREFFAGRGAAILVNEFLMVWLPVGAAVGLAVLARRVRRGAVKSP